jgi:hypothetical protein
MKILTAFRRFAVCSSGASRDSVPTQAMLDALAANRLQVCELGVPEPIEYGWSGARHIDRGHSGAANSIATSTPWD